MLSTREPIDLHRADSDDVPWERGRPLQHPELEVLLYDGTGGEVGREECDAFWPVLYVSEHPREDGYRHRGGEHKDLGFKAPKRHQPHQCRDRNLGRKGEEVPERERDEKGVHQRVDVVLPCVQDREELNCRGDPGQ